MLSTIQSHIQSSIQVKQAILADKAILNLIEKSARVIADAYRNGKKTLLAGNGGSAADAQHISGEFVSRFNFDRPAIPSIALSTDTSILTGIGNDYGYERLFARQIEAHGNVGDVFIAISTSGNSPNIIKALETCQTKGVISIGLTGESGGNMAALCDYCIKVPSVQTPRIQESHILIGHIMCHLVEDELFGQYRNVK
ncbi:D-sedoheptulose 7-phosphate isomerase [Mucilaginibacter robiniae]|uniref:Phosphoheptose isomerase n=1 Tax=Mucilaginibacter robiniae TaxID=2728022 RepID=A0A7L5E198_9SPHI|nr:D-sedoheptulose 7-phosphate isomerase [Mucilaginibacter robiniae]QJD96965.1 D-sedoheptulose 7-phosphate isomerase [Mucilaginibacter robiniae]